MKKLFHYLTILFIQLAFLSPVIAGEKVDQSVDLAGNRQATWYLPDDEPQGWILLQHGFQRNKSRLDHIATTYMDNGIMVLAINANSTGGNRSLARDIADALVDSPLTPPNGYELPEKLILAGHSAGGLMMSYTGGRLAERGHEAFSGLIMFDPVDKDNGMQPNNQAVIDYGRKVLSILANSGSCNSNNNAVSPLRALSDEYVGIKLTNGSKHFDAEGNSTGGIAAWICGGEGSAQNITYLQDFAINWARDMISGQINADYYPGGAKVSELINNGDGELIKEITITPPAAEFSFSVNELSVSFTDESSAGDDDYPIQSHEWSFGDGQSSMEQNPTHTYTNSGSYTVELTVTDTNGGTSSISKQVTVSTTDVVPDASFNHSANGFVVSFTDTSTDSDGTITQWSWDFDDGNTSSDANPTHDFGTAGTYFVSLTVTDNDGNVDTESKEIVLTDRPDCAPEEGCLRNGDTIENLSDSRGGTVFYYMDVPANASDLEFAISGGSGDADIYVRYGQEPTTSQYDYRPYKNGNNETVSVASPDAGIWHVMIRGYSSYSGLTLTADYSTSDTNEAPVAEFSSSNSGLTVSFTDASSDSDGTIAERLWSFGDGSDSTESNPTHTYDRAGTYTVTLVVSDDDGTTDQISKTVVVSEDSNGATPLINGQPIENLSGARNDEIMFVMDIPANTQFVDFQISGGTGDADMYIRFGAQPTQSQFDYRPYVSGNDETVSIPSPEAGKWYIMLQGYQSFEGVTLSGSF
ncbi:PKD domain-containing protein [Pleionea sediminis]|uniref:PKD domain-containing protein n=1 Tax=Pleionea sediminis TaxID=2569479 RepID=UPI001185DC54|nr:PKD domain-containing protein [Pleionea sediminis]